MDKINNDIFLKYREKRKSEISKDTNLCCIAVYQSKKEIYLVADRKFTNIKTTFTINKSSQKFSFDHYKFIEGAKRQYFFSLFMGFLKYEKIHLIFAEKVIIQKIGKFKYFKIQNIIALDLKKLTREKSLSIVLTEYYKNNYYFSYDFDMTYTDNYILAFQNEKKFFNKKKLNWCYFANRNIALPMLNHDDPNWVIPVIKGMIYFDKVKIQDSVMNLIFIQKTFITELNDKYLNDEYFFNDIYCPKDINNINVFFLKKGRVYLLNLCYNTFYKQFDKIKEGNTGDYFKPILNYKKFEKYLDYMIEIEKIEDFLFVKPKNDEDKTLEKILNKKKSYMNYKDKVSSLDVLADNSLEILLRQVKKLCKITFGEKKKTHFTFFNISINTDNVFEQFELTFPEIFITCLENIFPKVEKGFLIRIKSIPTIFLEKWEKTRKYAFFRKKLKQLLSEKKIKIIENKKLMVSIYGSDKALSKSLHKLHLKYHLPLYTYKNLQMTLITHNCAGSLPTKNILINYTEIESIKKSDIIIIGLQEIIEMKGKNLTQIIKNENTIANEKWSNCFRKKFLDFELVGNTSMLGLMIVFLVKKERLNDFDVSVFHHKLSKLGSFGLANKGGINVELKINGSLVNFINCHLESGSQKVNFDKRFQSLLGFEKDLNKKMNIDLSFFFGDTNFRNKEETENVKKLIEEYLKEKDQMKKHMILNKMNSKDELKNLFKNKTKGKINRTISWF